MKKEILKNLYDGNFREALRGEKEFYNKPEKEYLDEAYDAFEKTFSEEQKTLFDDYYTADNEYFCLILERTYTNAFKTGFWLAMELMDFDPAD